MTYSLNLPIDYIVSNHINPLPDPVIKRHDDDSFKIMTSFF